MITLVLDESGRIVHDCERDGCSVSWDGFILDEATYRQQQQLAGDDPKPGEDLSKGKPVRNRDVSEMERFNVRGNTAQLKRGA